MDPNKDSGSKTWRFWGVSSQSRFGSLDPSLDGDLGTALCQWTWQCWKVYPSVSEMRGWRKKEREKERKGKRERKKRKKKNHCAENIGDRGAQTGSPCWERYRCDCEAYRKEKSVCNNYECFRSISLGFHMNDHFWVCDALFHSSSVLQKWWAAFV